MSEKLIQTLIKQNHIRQNIIDQIKSTNRYSYLSSIVYTFVRRYESITEELDPATQQKCLELLANYNKQEFHDEMIKLINCDNVNVSILTNDIEDLLTEANDINIPIDLCVLVNSSHEYEYGCLSYWKTSSLEC